MEKRKNLLDKLLLLILQQHDTGGKRQNSLQIPKVDSTPKYYHAEATLDEKKLNPLLLPINPTSSQQISVIIDDDLQALETGKCMLRFLFIAKL